MRTKSNEDLSEYKRFGLTLLQLMGTVAIVSMALTLALKFF